MISDVVDLIPINGEDRDLNTLEVPNSETEFVHAKSFLQKGSSFSGDNLYDHLTDVLNKILSERPENVIDFFEEYSRKLKEKRFKSLTDHLANIFVAPGRYKLAKQIMPLLAPLKRGEPSTLDPDDLEIADMSRNNLVELLYYFEHAALGLPRTEMYCITLSMRQLIHSEPLSSIRFWGKIFGLEKNYIVAEAELKDEEYVKRNEIYQAIIEEPIAGGLEDQLAAIENQQEIEGEITLPQSSWPSFPPIPKILYEPPREPPSEPSGVGVNKKVYYVCNEPGLPWTQLPDITPEQIRMARRIYKSFTGNLEQSIVTYPSFPGTEREFLRAQIARISAGTQVAPLGYYTFGEEEMGEDEEMDEEADDGSKTEFRENPKYDPLPLKDLTERSMMFWVHCAPHILQQGRTTWWNPNPLPEGLDEEVGEEEDKPAQTGPEPETGPPLLTPCSEDVTLDAVPAWSVRSSSNIAEEYAIAVVRSNFWPGAYAFGSKEKLFQNIYLGSGLKAMSPNFSPAPLPPVEQDYPTGPEIMEILDPTGAQEEEWRIAHLPKEKPPPVIGMGEEEEAEEEEDEDDDDD